jgi:hypothetical protein
MHLCQHKCCSCVKARLFPKVPDLRVAMQLVIWQQKSGGHSLAYALYCIQSPSNMRNKGWKDTKDRRILYYKFMTVR